LRYKTFLIVIIILGCAKTLMAQNKSFVDSLSSTIENYSKRDKIKAIVAIPYDKAVADIISFERLADSSIQYAIELKDSVLLAKSYEQKLLASHFSSRNEETLNISLKCIRLYESLKDTLRLGNMYCELAWRLKYRDFDKAFNYMSKGIKLSEKFIDNPKLYNSYDNFGVLHGMKKQWDSAEFYHQKALKFRKKISDSIGIPFGYAHLANVYLKTKAYALAEVYIDSSLYIRERRNDVYGITDSQLYLGDLNYVQKRYEKALLNFHKAYQLSDKHKYFPLKKYASEYLSKSYRHLKNYQEALYYYDIFNTLKDSIVNVETNSRIARLEIEYQSEKNEKEILSQRADLAEKELDLNKKNSYIFGLIALAIILVLLSYLIYSQQRLKNRQLQKENELKDALVKIETQNSLQDQRLRISRDLHDNIGAQLTFIISSLDNLKYGFKLPDSLNDKLKSISSFTTTTIYELRDTIWAMNKHEITFEDLQSRISNFIDKAIKSSENVAFNFKRDTVDSKALTFNSITGMNIYRIIQEAIHNALKYAEAKKIEVIISTDQNTLSIQIKDDGKGFDIDKIEHGNGLFNMKKRAHIIAAEYSIHSELDNGTMVQITLNI